MNRSGRGQAILIGLALCLGLTACTATSTASLEHWIKFRHIPGIVDLAIRDGSLVVAADGRLFILRTRGALKPYATGPGGYKTGRGTEPYIAITGNERVAGTRCSFGAGTIFALQPDRHRGVIRIGTGRRVSRLASLPAKGELSGIAFDSTGDFGHDLVVTRRVYGRTTVLAINCYGHTRVITSKAPPLEGGMVVAPASFGRFGGDLIAPCEGSGLVYAIRPNGTVALLARSGLPHGGDIGVESEGFVPRGLGSGAAYLSDRFSRGSLHPGDNSLLRLSGADLLRAGVRAGDLLVATEASARTIDVRCATKCTVRLIAIGPAIAHVEGHIVFGR